MTKIAGLDVLFVSGFGPIVRDHFVSVALYRDTLGLPLTTMDGNPTYFHGEGIDGVRHFAMWPLAQAAQSCFATDTWPADVPAPQAWIEFDVEDVATATEALKAQGYKLLVNARKEPWGQTVSRFLTPEGLLAAVTHTPWMRI
jgi:catechol 2,3-dioxygenase-like lactoylglutathione lyase family enzyme